MKNIIAIVMISVVLFSGIALVQAKQDKSKDNKKIDEEYIIPEENGIYNVPGHPEMKVKVFVHKAKGGKKPKPTSPPVDENPVCGLQNDDSSNAFVGTTGWKLPSNWTYTLNLASVPSSVGSENLKAIVERSFDAWSTASGVNFSETTDTTNINRARYDGKNIIAWGRTSASALAITYTTYYVNSGIVVDVDTIMNKRYPWSWTDQLISSNLNCAYANSYDAQNIMTHELGHWMGLNDYYESVYANHTMYGYGSKSEVKKNTLTEGDKDGIYDIYNIVP